MLWRIQGITVVPRPETKEHIDVFVCAALSHVLFVEEPNLEVEYLHLYSSASSMDSFSQFSIPTPFHSLTNQDLNFADDSLTTFLHSTDIVFDRVNYSSHLPTGFSTMTPMLHSSNTGCKSIFPTDGSSHGFGHVIGGANLGSKVCFGAHHSVGI